MYTVQRLLATLENCPRKTPQPSKKKAKALAFIIFRLILVFWLVTMISCSVMASKPCVKRGQRCSLLVITVVASALSDLLVIAHLTTLEIYECPFDRPWTVRIGRPTKNYRTSSFTNATLDPTQFSFSSASTLYEKGLSRSSSRGLAIKRKPLPQPSSVPGDYPVRPSPHTPPAIMSGARHLTGHIADLSNDGGMHNGLSPLDSTALVDKCSCRRIYHVDSRQVPHISAPKRVRLDRTVPISPVKKPSSSSKRYFFAQYLNVCTNSYRHKPPASNPTTSEHRAILPSIPPPHKWNLSRTASLSDLLPVTEQYSSQPKNAPSSVPSKLRRRLKNDLLAFRSWNEVSLLPRPDRDPYAVKVPGAYNDSRHG